MFFLERTDRTKVEDDFGLEVRKLDRWTRPCFSRFMQVPFAHQREVAPFNAPTRRSNLSLGAIFGPLLALRSPPNSGQTNPSPVASAGGRSVNLEPLWERTGGTQTHSRRTRSRLGQLRCTRQGLVRVPESNTKYGGKRRKTGVASCPLCRQVSVSPQGFPSEKNCFHRAHFSFVPLFTGQLFIVAEGLLSRDSGGVTKVRAAMPGRRWPRAMRTGKVRPHPTGLIP
jgi:hypothetical protein